MQQNEQTSAHPLIEMHLEEFRRGYQSGCAGRNPCTEPLTDQDMIDALKTFVEEGLFLPENEELLQWHIGRLLGEINYQCGQQARSTVACVLIEGQCELQQALRQLQGIVMAAATDAKNEITNGDAHSYFR
jgi:hypothetical protein